MGITYRRLKHMHHKPPMTYTPADVSGPGLSRPRTVAKILLRVPLFGAIAGFLLLRALAQQHPQPTSAQTWRLDTNNKRPALFHAKSGRHGWADVSPIALLQMAKEIRDSDFYEHNCALCPIDNDHAWIAINLHDRVVVDYTSSGGQHWVQKKGPPASESVFISFPVQRQGFVLTASGSIGNHQEWVYETGDGGEHWKAMPSPTREGSSYYANGIVFRNSLEGWITASYHGVPDAPLFHTEDGAKTWTLQAFPIPADYHGGYATTYPPAFLGKDKMKGILPVDLVRHEPAPDHRASVNYETVNGGATWLLPKSGVHSTSFN